MSMLIKTAKMLLITLNITHMYIPASWEELIKHKLWSLQYPLEEEPTHTQATNVKYQFLLINIPYRIYIGHKQTNTAQCKAECYII